MAHKASRTENKHARSGDQEVIRGGGGETHQIGDNHADILTSQQGIPIVDDQNSLKIGARGPVPLEDFHFAHSKFVAYVEVAIPLLEKVLGREHLDAGFIQLQASEDVAKFVQACRRLRYWQRA